ncbi:sugar phosphate isomerase/epimerase family protein [Brevundimonas sp. TWP2-3-4b1]|uniref:sugar phosphate isomerase/epimerase family protein n=1 Tax=Brevundimonas sp. TWP2-3-4b1 TaxID=2804580 RepID=UPI003CF527E8
MSLGISNIAWHADETVSVYETISSLGVGYLEISPSLAFPDAEDALSPSEADVERWAEALTVHGLRACSMQSLLFGDAEARIFGSPPQQERFLSRIGAAIRLAGRLGIPHLTFGCPTSRSLTAEVSQAEAGGYAAETFRKLARLCSEHGCRLGLEPMAGDAGAVFLTKLSEVAHFVEMVDHPSVAMTLDTGAMLAADDLSSTLGVIETQAGRISHVQLSAPGLVGFPIEDPAVVSVIVALRANGYRGGYSVEMRAGHSNNIEVVQSALMAAKRMLSDEYPSHRSGPRAPRI